MLVKAKGKEKRLLLHKAYRLLKKESRQQPLSESWCEGGGVMEVRNQKQRDKETRSENKQGLKFEHRHKVL